MGGEDTRNNLIPSYGVYRGALAVDTAQKRGQQPPPLGYLMVTKPMSSHSAPVRVGGYGDKAPQILVQQDTRPACHGHLRSFAKGSYLGPFTVLPDWRFSSGIPGKC
jgi:hypothetical protein